MMVPFRCLYSGLVAWFGKTRYIQSTFGALVVEAPSRWVLSSEDAFDGVTWQQVEDATRALATVTVGSFAGERVTGNGRHVSIHYRLYDTLDEKHGYVVIVAGFTEAVVIYQEAIYDFVRNGFSVYAYDHRGQGFSSRLLEGEWNADKGHIDSFDHLVSDLDRFIALVRRRRASRRGRMHILANSMGGAVVSLYMSTVESLPASVAMIAPMHQIKLGFWTSVLLSSRVLRVLLPFASSVRVHGGDFTTSEACFSSVTALSDNEMSHSMSRLRRRWSARRATWTDASGYRHDARISGVTLRWLVDAFDAARRSRRQFGSRYVASHDRILCPTMLLQAENDDVVDADGQCAYWRGANATRAGSCRAFCVAGARHLILHEVDAYRNPALGAVMSFFASKNQTQ